MDLIKKTPFIFALLFLVACGPGVLQNNKGTSSFRSEDYLTAREFYIGALLERPESIQFRYNLAIANTAGERLSDALKELDAIEESYKNRKVSEADYEDLFKLYFAKAFLHGLTQNVDQALEYYQKALRIKPDAVDVKKNIELLIQQKKSQEGKDGKPSKDKKDGGKKGDKSDKGDNKDSKGKDKDKQNMKGQDEESLKKKNLSKEEIEQILKEIKDQESKVRAKESQKNKEGQKRGKGANGKTW